MHRHFFLIALLSVLLPGAVLPGSRDAVAPRPFVSSLRMMPGAGRAIARSMRQSAECRPVRGVYIIPSRRPKSSLEARSGAPLQDRLVLRPHALRAPPALA